MWEYSKKSAIKWLHHCALGDSSWLPLIETRMWEAAGRLMLSIVCKKKDYAIKMIETTAQWIYKTGTKLFIFIIKYHILYIITCAVLL